MNAVGDFFVSLKEDLLGKRLLPYLIVLGVVLLAAVGFAVRGGGSSSAPTPVASSVPAGASAAVGDVTVSQAPANPNQPISETTEGTSKQHRGVAHDPFTPLPEAKQASSASTSSSTSTSSSSSSTSSSLAPSSSSRTILATPTATPTETTPAKPKLYVHYHVTAQLGVVPVVAEGATPQPAELKTYSDMALDEQLPDKANSQLVFLGVVLGTGKEALFGLAGAAILHGSAGCKPSATQCQAIGLQVGQSEQLEVVEADGGTVTYELKLVSIGKSVSTGSTARVRDAFRAQAKATRELARRAPKLSELRYSPWGGGLVFAGHPAFAAHAHAARHRGR